MDPSTCRLTPAEDSFYLPAGRDMSFVTYHAAPSGLARDAAILLCPPLGWEEVCSYRSLREWATSLADGGYPALRLTLPSTGDSGGSPGDPDRLAAWDEAVRGAAGWLRSVVTTRRIVAIGMGLGGLLAYRAAALSGVIDDLVLWGTPSSGRSLVRHWRAFAGLESARFFEGLTPPPARDDGSLEAGGFLLTAETVRDLHAIDLVSLPLNDPSRRHVLLLEQDGIAVDDRLHGSLRDLGAHVQVRPGPGYAQMTSHPQQATPSPEVMGTIRQWLGDSARPGAQIPLPPAAHTAGSGPPVGTARLEATAGAASWTETPVSITHGSATLSGVLVEPAAPATDGLCVVLLNAGAVRRIGPSRMWVEASRRWAGRGVPTLRLDVEGIGDSSGPPAAYANDATLYTNAFLEQVTAAMDALEARGTGRRFILGGLCAGAYWAFHVALRDERARAVLMVNPRVLVWDENLAPARYMRTLLLRRPSPAHIREVITWALVRQVAGWLLRSPRRLLARRASPRARQSTVGSEVDRLLQRLRATETRAMLLFSEREPLHDELAASGRLAELERSPAITLEHIAVNDHTLRPTWAQARAHAALDAALERELATQPAEAARRSRTSASDGSAVSGKSSSSPHRTQTAS